MTSINDKTMEIDIQRKIFFVTNWDFIRSNAILRRF